MMFGLFQSLEIMCRIGLNIKKECNVNNFIETNENCAININYVNEIKINSRIERDFEIENRRISMNFAM